MKVLAPALFVVSLLTACGQTGPLVLPGKEHKPAVSPLGLPAPATKSGDDAAPQQDDTAPAADSKNKPAAKP